MTPQSAKWRTAKPEKHYTGKNLRPLNKYRHAKSLDEYFWQRVEQTNGCWKFATAGDKDGYPQVVGSKHCKQLGLTRAHQVSYFLHHGAIPEDKIICHTCDNPWCVNPEHLFLGTWNDNVQDMIIKGRYIHPTEVRPMGKLSLEDKEEIKTRKGFQTSFQVAKEFNISFSRVCQIWRGE
jgi:hypothetical protein